MHSSAPRTGYDKASELSVLQARSCCWNKTVMQMCAKHLVQAVIAGLTAKDNGRCLGPDGKDIDYSKLFLILECSAQDLSFAVMGDLWLHEC